MNSIHTLTNEILDQFVAGKLNPEQTETVLALLAEDEASLERVDALWAQQPVAATLPQLPPQARTQQPITQQRVLRRIHQNDLTLNMLLMGTHGFAQVTASLLRPFVHPNPHKPSRRKRNRS
jgi:hypothetical protein